MRIPDHIDPDDFEALADWVESDDFDPGPGRDAAPLRRVVSAAEAVEHAQAQLADAARAAHSAGLSWTTIGAVLGVSRQAARQRFGTPART